MDYCFRNKPGKTNIWNIHNSGLSLTSALHLYFVDATTVKKSSIVCFSFIMQIFNTRSGRMKIDGNLQTKQRVSLKPLTNLNLYLISIIEVWIFLYCTCTISLEFNLITHFLESHNLYRWLTTISQIEVPLYGYLLWILRVIWTNSLKCFFYSCCLF